ncbi:MAG: hypothetical protein QNJ20_14905 [Paracoccaceae bacterium]|nr:hypothetical protein [Paracoccaceae bacterium]
MSLASIRNAVITWLVIPLCLIATASLAEGDEGWSVTVFGGVLTDNDWQYAVQPWEVEFVDSRFVGVAFGREWRLGDPRWTIGFEAQAVQHFGRQDHLEFNLPAVLRYHPRNPIPARLESLAFGLGVSHASELAQVEIERQGASRHNLVYWMAELEFSTGRADTTWMIRLHHRSDAFGLLEPATGSNAIAFGIRRAF